MSVAEDTARSTAVARGLIEGYFRALEAADFEAAAACFTEDVAYSHPPFPEEGADAPRHESRGQAALLEVFRRRGQRSLRHRVDTVLAGDATALAAGVVLDDGHVVMSFVAEATIDRSTELLSRYAAYASVPPVWAVLEGER